MYLIRFLLFLKNMEWAKPKSYLQYLTLHPQDLNSNGQFNRATSRPLDRAFGANIITNVSNTFFFLMKYTHDNRLPECCSINDTVSLIYRRFFLILPMDLVSVHQNYNFLGTIFTKVQDGTYHGDAEELKMLSIIKQICARTRRTKYMNRKWM